MNDQTNSGNATVVSAGTVVPASLIAVILAVQVSVLWPTAATAADCRGTPARWTITGPGTMHIDRSVRSRHMSSEKPDLFAGVQYGRTPRKFTHEAGFRFEGLRNQPGCYQLTSVRVLITTQEPYTVQLARELRAGTCTYKVVHHHEFLHARVTTAAIDRMIADARSEAGKGVVPSIKKFKSEAAARKAFGAQINKLVKGAIRKHLAAAVRNHKRIDSKTAKAGEQRACKKSEWDQLAKSTMR